MQSLAPSNAGGGDKIGSDVASSLCHASIAPLKSNHAGSHGDEKKGLIIKKPSSLPLKQNSNVIQKPIIGARPLQKPEIPACIEACDVSSLLDKFLEYELNQNANIDMAKNSSVALTPVSSPSHKSNCNLTEALDGKKKLSISSTVGLTPPVSPPSHQSVHPTKSSSTVPSTPLTTHNKTKHPSTSPTETIDDSKKQARNTTNGNSIEKVTMYSKAPKDATMINMKNETSTHLTSSTTQQNGKTEKSRNDPCHGNKKVVEKPSNGSEQQKSQEKSSVDKRFNDSGYQHLKRSYSSDEDDDNDKGYYDYKRRKYATRDECYWSTSEDESDDDRRSYHSRRGSNKISYRRRRSRSSTSDSDNNHTEDESDHERRHYRSRRRGSSEHSYRRRRSRSRSCDSDDNRSSYGKSRSHTSNYKQQRIKDAESKKENHMQKGPVYDIETERKNTFKLDRSFRETATEKRKIVYIGNIKESMTKDDVWRRFREYGPIEKVTVHYRKDGDNYSFVTFIDSSSALEAIERGSKDPDLKHLDICFGGRRKFCGGSYVDFDSNTSYLEEKQMDGGASSSQSKNEEMDFDALLKMCQRKSR